MSGNLRLPISGIAPDPLRISNVSGFYGPGAWSAWYLTTVASWHDILRRSKSRRAYNTILHLLGTNWAAIDVLRQLHIIQKNDVGQTAHSSIPQGALAAAITLTYWGLITALWQFVWLYYEQDWRQRHVNRRCFLLLAGALLPSVSLAQLHFLLSSLWTRDEDKFARFENNLPTFYWDGIDSGFHLVLLQSAAIFGLASAIFVPLVLIRAALQTLSRITQSHILEWKIMQRIVRSTDLTGIVSTTILLGGPTYLFISLAALRDAYALYVRVAITITTLLAFPVMSAWNVFIPTLYLGKILSTPGIDIRKSCFYMPCAPQSIGEWDQAFGLVAGLVSLAVEMRSPIVAFKTWIWTKRERLRQSCEPV